MASTSALNHLERYIKERCFWGGKVWEYIAINIGSGWDVNISDCVATKLAATWGARHSLTSPSTLQCPKMQTYIATQVLQCKGMQCITNKLDTIQCKVISCKCNRMQTHWIECIALVWVSHLGSLSVSGLHRMQPTKLYSISTNTPVRPSVL